MPAIWREWTIRLAEQRAFGIFNATGPARPLTMGAMLKQIASGTHSDAKLDLGACPIPGSRKSGPVE